MNRLVAFGCSFTYGHGLADCHVDPNYPGPEPSKLAWPSILSDLLKLQVINRSRPGASNLHILWNLLNFEFKKDDTCFILWTYFHRYIYSILNEDPSKSLWDEGGLKGMQKAQTDENNLLIKNFICIHHASLYLKSINVKHYFLFGPTLSTTKLLSDCPKSLHTDSLFLDIPIIGVDSGLDGSHPGPKTHANFALRIFNKLNVIH